MLAIDRPSAAAIGMERATAVVVTEPGLRTTATHLQSGTAINTDAPTDNMGRGEAFSPTDLLATALLTCGLTTICIAFQKRGLPEPRMQGGVLKIMADSPRRVARLEINVQVLDSLPDDQRRLLEATFDACPVARSLSPEVQVATTFQYA